MPRHAPLSLILLFWTACVGCQLRATNPRAVFVRSLDWAEKGVWLKADTHVHTNNSDGGVQLAEVVRQGQAHGCDVLAITDHGDANLQATSEEYFEELETARRKFPKLILLAGLEWNVPPWQGREHATVLVSAGPHERKLLRDFQALFDDYHRDGRDPDLALSALRWLEAHSHGIGGLPVVFYNHPSRQREQPLELVRELTHWRAESPLAVGFEGAPGHQDSQPIGVYREALQTIDRWDPVAAQVGGAWDQMLQQGLPVWGALAASDFHNADPQQSDDFWPGEFSETWLYAPSSTPEGALSALRAGSFFAEHGHIVRNVQLRAFAEGLSRPAVAGEAIRVSPGATLAVTLTLEVPLQDWQGKANQLDEVELIAVTPQEAHVLRQQRPRLLGNALEIVLPMPQSDLTIRARGRRIVPDGPDLMFYTNPIQIFTSGMKPTETVTATSATTGLIHVSNSDNVAPRPIPAWIPLAFVIGCSLLFTLLDRWRLEAQRRFSRKQAGMCAPTATTSLPVKRHLLAGLACFVLLAVYGSWVPLKWTPMDRATAMRRMGELLEQPLSFASRTDWATNVVLFVPIGFLATGLLLGRGPSDRRRAVTLPLVVLGCVVLSLAIEFGQLWIAERTCSQNDVIAESLGGLLGGSAWFVVGAAVVGWLDGLRQSTRPRERLERLLEAYLLALIAYMLMPLDLTLRPAEIYDKFQHGQINLVPFQDVLRSGVSFLQLLGDTLLLVPIGVLVALWRWPKRDNTRPLGRSLLMGAFLVAAIEACQLLVQSRFSSTTDLITGSMGIALGWAIVSWFVRQGIKAAPNAKRQWSMALGLLFAALLYGAVLVALFCLPYDKLSSPLDAQARLAGLFARPPLVAFYAGTELNAVSEILRKVLLFGLLGSLLGLAAGAAPGRLRRRRLLLAAAWLGAAAVACGIELAQVWLPPHIPDTTDALLGMLGAGLGLAVVTWLSAKE